jgi:hypothetical protein
MIHALLLATQVFINGQALNASVIESNGTIYVPVDAVAKALGVEVTLKQEVFHIATPLSLSAPAATTAPVAPPPPPPVASKPTPWVQQLPPLPPPTVAAIRGRLTWTQSIITTHPSDIGAQVWLLSADEVTALAKSAGGTNEEPIPASATGWPAKLNYPATTADTEGRFGFDNVAPGVYTLIMVSQHANGLAARDRHGKMRFKKIVVHAGEIVDASFNFGVTAYKD